jgi:tetratricopeptide (TPR) repeat protein
MGRVGFFDKLTRFVDDVLLLPEEARELAESAQALLDAGDPAAALDRALAALAVRDDHPQLLYLVGEASSRLGDAEQAERMFRVALDLDPSHARSRVGLARQLRQGGRSADAAELLRPAVPNLVGAGEKVLAVAALDELARCHLDLGRPDRAARELRKAISLRTDDALLHARLARVLSSLSGEEGSARAAARKAVDLVDRSKDGPLLREVGAAALAAGLDAEAVDLLGRALDCGERTHLLLGRAYLALGDAVSAHDHALRAVADEPSSPEPHRLRARLALRAGDPGGALAALEAALALEPDDLVTLRLALETTARAGRGLERAGALARRILLEIPDDHLALAIGARASIAAGEPGPGAAETLARVADRTPGLDEAWIGLAELAIRERRGEDALAALERAEAASPGRPEIDRLGADACRLVASGGSGAEPDLFDVLERVHQLLARQAHQSELAVEVGGIREDYDKPLLLTVMGEFNTGKSTFINALIGEPVAPMGITPTTATINVLKYGPERKVRVFHRSGTVKELPYDALGGWLKSLSREAAVEVRQVEILYPAEELTRVNLVDTPGFNSIVPEHTRIARQFVDRADAVVWLFDAGQAGKESEREALSLVTAEGKRVLGVLNKSDRLAPEALEQVLAHLEREALSPLLEEVVPLSARVALDAKQGSGDDGALARSGLPRLQERLDALFYSRARLIKRAGCAGRLVAVLDRAIANESAANAELRRGVAVTAQARAALAAMPDRLARDAGAFAREELDGVRRAVAREAAAEILEFVRPRRHLLDSHRFSPEDRSYLVELIEERLSTTLEGLMERLERQAEAAISELMDELRASEEVLLAVAPDYGREGEPRTEMHEHAKEFGRTVGWALLAFSRGLLRGGKSDRFFDDELPRIELDEATLARRIASWWDGTEAVAQENVRHGAVELARRLDARFLAEASRLRAELARRSRLGSRPLAGFATLAREWARAA